jgi:hypothetical protein
VHLKSLIVAGVITVAIGAAAATHAPQASHTMPDTPPSPAVDLAPPTAASAMAAAPRALKATHRRTGDTRAASLVPVAKVPGDNPNLAYVRALSAERYEAFVRKAALTPSQVDALNGVLVDVAADLETLHQDLEKARSEADAEGWLAYQNNAWEAIQDDIVDRISKILTAEQLSAVNGELGILEAFPASTLAGLHETLLTPRQ